jgi:RNA polymerase sigma factor (sigma-70 family)
MAMGSLDQFPTDEEFYDLVRKAPDKALERVMRSIGGQLLGYLTNELHNPHDAEDCLQEAMIRVMSDLPAYDGKIPARAWVFLRVKWTVLKWRQRVARKLPRTPETESRPITPRVRPDSMLRSKESAEAFLSGLPESKRELIEKHLVLGWSHAETAAEYGLSAEAVRKAYSRVLAAFKSHLEEDGLLS